jgi:aminopeptidase C
MEVDGRYKLAEFEYSQQYLFFWDKLEKANCMVLRRGWVNGRLFGVYD